MPEELLQCPLVTEYTKLIGLNSDMLEKLFVLRQWNIEDKTNPIPFNWPSLLRKELSPGVPLDLRQYQIQQVHHLCRMPRFIDGDSVGLGKTIEAIAAATWIKERFPKAKIVILATKSTTWQWFDEIIRFSYLQPYVMRDTYKGISGHNARLAQMMAFLEDTSKKDVMICKYSSLIGKRRIVTDKDGVQHKELVSQEIKAMATIFKQHGNNIILITDECQKYKGPGTSIRKLVMALARYAGKTWALSATVIKNDLSEFYNIAYAIGIRPLGDLADFAENHCNFYDQHIGGGRFIPVLSGYKNVARFKEQLRPFFLGRSQKQVKEPLPLLSTLFHPVELDAKQTKLLLEDIPNGTFQLPPAIIKEAGQIFEKERDPNNQMTMLSVQQLVANHWALIDRYDEKTFHTTTLSPKEEALLDMLDGDFRDEKVIAFAQPLSAKILTPTGWKTMGKIRIGDAVVDPDGGVGYVEGVYPQGEKEIFRVTTKSRASTEVTGDHLWLYQTPYGRDHGIWKVRSTYQILKKGLQRIDKTGRDNQYHKAFLPLPGPTEFCSHTFLPIPPYTLGVLLGDGDISSGGVTFGVEDGEIADRVGKECLEGIELRNHGGQSGSPKCIGYSLSTTVPTKKDHRGYNVGQNNRYLNSLRDLGLCQPSNKKFIPRIYLQASLQDRIELLRGYLDTDGCCTKGGCVSSGSVSKQLSLDVAELVRSLGGLAYFNGPIQNFYNHQGIRKQGQDSWDLVVQVPFNPFYLERKARRWKPAANPLNPIHTIELVGQTEVQCIKVSTKRSLYITDDYIVTHNTKYRSWIDRLEWLTKNGHFTKREFLRITGAEDEKQRRVSKALFQDPESKHDLIVLNSAGIEGINLQQAAHMLCLDLPWSWGDLIQLVGRMVRMASPHSACTLHVLISKGTIDEYTVETLKGKKGVFEKILGESHSAGILDDRLLHDLDSGMEHVGSDAEFKSMLHAHCRSVGMKSFLEGDLIAAASNEDYKMIFEKGGKAKRRKRRLPTDEEIDAKWNL
jgi:hypothetical protein